MPMAMIMVMMSKNRKVSDLRPLYLSVSYNDADGDDHDDDIETYKCHGEP